MDGFWEVLDSLGRYGTGQGNDTYLGTFRLFAIRNNDTVQSPNAVRGRVVGYETWRIWDSGRLEGNFKSCLGW